MVKKEDFTKQFVKEGTTFIGLLFEKEDNFFKGDRIFKTTSRAIFFPKTKKTLKIEPRQLKTGKGDPANLKKKREK